MPSEIMEIWNIAKEIIKDISLYIMPIAAVLVSVVALIKSNKCTQVQVKLSEMEQKLQEYDLALKKYKLEKLEREVNREKKACVEARIIKISQGKYKLKVWNSGDTTAYNIDVEILSDYNSENALTIFGALAQEKSANISKRIKFGKKMNSEKAIRQVFRYYTEEGYGTSKIANMLNERGIKTKRGSNWS